MATQVSGNSNNDSLDSSTDLSAQYPLPETPPTPSTFTALKERIRHHYELASSYYYSLWGEHIHHGYFDPPTLSKEAAQRNLITLLLRISSLPKGSSVLDVGCGIGGTSRYLVKEHGCHVLGITISGTQVSMATKLSLEAGGSEGGDTIELGEGSVRFLELDAETMGTYFTNAPHVRTFDAVWISEALSHFPQKQLFFANTAKLLKSGGRLVIADWFKAEGLSKAQMDADIRLIEDGMLLPPLCTWSDYVSFAKTAELTTITNPIDISEQVKQTWDISWSLIQNPSLWAFAFTQGRDGIAFLQAFRAMRRGYANGTFRYAVMAFHKDSFAQKLAEV